MAEGSSIARSVRCMDHLEPGVSGIQCRRPCRRTRARDAREMRNDSQVSQSARDCTLKGFIFACLVSWHSCFISETLSCLRRLFVPYKGRIFTQMETRSSEEDSMRTVCKASSINVPALIKRSMALANKESCYHDQLLCALVLFVSKGGQAIFNAYDVVSGVMRAGTNDTLQS